MRRCLRKGGAITERKRNQFDLPGIYYFQAGNTYTGSKGKLRFRIDVDDQIRVACWRTPLCFELSEMENTGAFPLTEEGYDGLIAWLDGEYAATE